MRLVPQISMNLNYNVLKLFLVAFRIRDQIRQIMMQLQNLNRVVGQKKRCEYKNNDFRYPLFANQFGRKIDGFWKNIFESKCYQSPKGKNADHPYKPKCLKSRVSRQRCR